MTDPIDRLRTDLRDRVTDPCTEGTVISWTYADRYPYAAIQAGDVWFTTARQSNTAIPSVVTYEELVKILRRPETSDIALATEWTGVDE